RKVVVDVVCRVAAGNPVAAEENVFVESGVAGGSRQVGFVQYVAASTIPVNHAVALHDALPVPIIAVGDSRGRLDLILRVVRIRYRRTRWGGLREHIARRVIAV